MALPAHVNAHGFQPKRTAWRVLEHHYKKIRSLHLRDLFAGDPKRGERLSVEGAGIYLDYSKNRVTDQTLKLLVQLANESGLQARIDAMFRGERINITEKQPALHVALRVPRGASIFVDGENVVPRVHSVLDKMGRLANSLRSGEWKGYSGKRIRNVINIGNGGWHGGPVMAYEALKDYSDRSLTFRFMSSVEGTTFSETVQGLEPSETLFIICGDSSMSTHPTSNASTARAWLLSSFDGDERSVGRHFTAVSTSPAEAIAFGIDPVNVFDIWGWVGERFSIASAVGLSTMIAVGSENFRAMLDGFHQMDMHFLTTPFEQNLPVLVGLLAVWYVNLFGVRTIAVWHSEQRLGRFLGHVQELMMGSNGKSVTLIGTEVTRATGPIYWAKPGADDQDPCHQFIQQGTTMVPCDFFVFGAAASALKAHHDASVANVFAQAEALAFGISPHDVKAQGVPEWLVPHRVLEGNRPSNIILLDRLSPETLGKLIALYEHCAFTQGAIWNINPFDHWGMELKASLAERITAELSGVDEPQLEHDSSTNALIRRYRKLQSA